MKEKIEKIYQHLTVLGFSAIVFVTVIQVIARFVFDAPLMWGEELCRYIFVWVVMFAVGLGIMTGEHISFTMLSNRLSPRGQFFLFMLGQVFINAFAVVLFIYGIRLSAQNATILSSAMKVPMAVPYAGIPAGVIGIVFFNILAIGEQYKTMKQKTGECHPGKE